jgi:hypothetical protein
LGNFEGHRETEDLISIPTGGEVHGLKHVVGSDRNDVGYRKANTYLKPILGEGATSDEAVFSGDVEELVVYNNDGASRGSEWQSVFDARAEAKPGGGGAFVGETAFDQSA